MRVPTSLQQNNMLYTIRGALSRITTLQTQIATGKRVHKPSDDPTGTYRMLAFRRSLDANQQFQKNIGDGLRWTTVTEGAMTSVVDSLLMIKEAAIQGAGDSGADRPVLGFSIDAMLDEIIDLSRTMLDDRYIFSGYSTSAEPYSESTTVTGEQFTAGAVGVETDLTHAQITQGSMVIQNLAGTVTYAEGTDYTVDYETGRVTILGGGAMTAGTAYSADYLTESVSSVVAAPSITGDMLRQIDENRTTIVNLTGSEVFEDTVDIFQMAIDLKNALWKDDGTAVNALLDRVDSAIEHTTHLLGIVGSRSRSMETQQTELEKQELYIQGLISDIESADLSEVIMNLEGEKLGYEAALTAAAQMYDLNLMRFL